MNVLQWKSNAAKRQLRRKNESGMETLPLLPWEKVLQWIEPNNSKLNPEKKVTKVILKPCFGISKGLFSILANKS